MINEVWLPVVGYEGLYEVSDKGRVRSLDRYFSTSRRKTFNGVVLCPVRTPSGYPSVQLCKDFKSKRFMIHRLVCTAFHKPEPGKDHIDHIDYDKQNNNASNLRWVNNLENQRHSAVNRLGLKNKSSTPVLHTEYGIYFSYGEARKVSGWSDPWFHKMLKGTIPNKTLFIYV